MLSNPSPIRCAIYTRKSTEEGLGQEFNSLDAQRECGEAYIASQQGVGWVALAERYDDGGYSGSNLERPALQRLLRDIEAGQIDCVVIYKVDRLSRSLFDFARLMQIFENRQVSFVSVTQQLNSNTPMGRLTLNVLLSFAQFERELIGERTRDKQRAARRKGKWTGGWPVLGYDADPVTKRLVVNEGEAEQVRKIFALFVKSGSLVKTVEALAQQGISRKQQGKAWDTASLRRMLGNGLYRGIVRHEGKEYAGEQAAIVERRLWERAQTLLAKPQEKSARRIKRPQSSLDGLLTCGGCASRMSSVTAKRGERRYRYYVCPRKCEKGSISAERLEAAVKGALENHPPEAIAQVIWSGKQSEWKLRLKAELEVDERSGKIADKAPAAKASAGSGPMRLPRITRLMALAIRFEGLLQTGVVTSYAELARLGGVTPPRITQIMNLRQLSPVIQEQLLFLRPSTKTRQLLPELTLRQLSQELRWDEQWREFQRLDRRERL